MKKISFLLALLITGTALFAQGPKFGLKGGLNISTLRNETGADFNTRLGFHAGALAHIHLSPQFALQPELVYSSQGTKYTISEGEHSLGLNFINIPLNLQYMFSNGFRLQTGPQVGFLIDVNDEFNGQETNIFTSDDFQNVDISWTAGLGYLSQTGFGIDARYNHGLNNINDLLGSPELKQSVFQVGIFYMFDNMHKAKSR